jgi:hypothetical protein
MSLPLLFGYLGCVLLAAALASRLAKHLTLSRPARVAVASGGAAAMLVPLDGLLLAGYLRGIVGDLSIVTQAMLAACIFSHVLDRKLLDRREMGAVMAAAFAGGLFLYPATLGLMHFDPYALGFGSPYLAATLAALTLVASYLRLYWLAACLLVAVSARLANALESQNLWDYLLDPLLALYAGFWLSRALIRRITPVPLNLGSGQGRRDRRAPRSV